MLDFAGSGKTEWRLPTIEAAKAAAQADYTARVLAALEPLPTHADLLAAALALPEVAALVETLEAIREAVTQHHLAYDRREHGGVADGHLATAVQRIMGMEWRQGVATSALAAMRTALDTIETMTATADGISPAQVVTIHSIALAALEARHDQD